MKNYIKKITIDALMRKLTIFIDKLKGLDFLTCVESEDIGLDPQIVYRYAPSGDKYLRNILKNINITKDDSIIDIGCGKGSAMRVMQKFAFAKVDGIEISRQLADIAVSNFKKLNVRKSRVFCCDAATFTQFSDYNLFYFYNPFPHEIMSRVIGSLRGLIKSDKEILIIYNNPFCHDLFINEPGLFKIAEYSDEWSNKIFIYSNRSIEFSRSGRAKIK